MERRKIDVRLSQLERWIPVAGDALNTFYWSPGRFLRSSIHTAEAHRIRPTSINRCLFALVEYLRFLRENHRRDDSAVTRVVEMMQKVSDSYLNLVLTDPMRARTSGSNGVNLFTDSQLLISLVACASPNVATELATRRGRATPLSSPTARAIGDAIFKRLIDWKGGKVAETDHVTHDFVTVFAVRALDHYWARRYPEKVAAVEKIIKKGALVSVLKQLAFASAEISSGFDAPELIFSVHLINRFSVPETNPLTVKALSCIAEAQRPDGSWPAARPVSYDSPSLLHLASYETALAIADLFLKRLRQGDPVNSEEMIGVLDKAFGLVSGQYGEVDVTIGSESRRMMGWSNDHTRLDGLVESWATAIVLTFLIRYRDCLLLLRQNEILDKYHAFEFRNVRVAEWPEWNEILGHLDYDPSILKEISDPHGDRRLTSAIETRIVQPIVQDALHRPEARAFILLGPPGTRKTSLVKLVARCLGWPLLTLTPPDFLQSGLEGLESSARATFDDLACLRRVVIFMDECEEFFRRRQSDAEPANRTMGAFITSGMLPRLQALSDLRWSLFALATNLELEDLDDAVRRLGRFDYAIPIGYPSTQAQWQYVERKLREPKDQKLKVPAQGAIDWYAFSDDAESYKLSFSHLDLFVDQLRERRASRRLVSIPYAKSLLKHLATRKVPPTLSEAEVLP